MSGLPARMLAILAVVMLLDFGVNAVLFQRAGNFALHEEEAQSLAERLASAYRTLDAAPTRERAALARELGSETLTLRWTPRAPRPVASIDLAALKNQLMQYDPVLANARLELQLQPVHIRNGLDGSMGLSDGSLVLFQSKAHDTWLLQVGQIVRMLLPTVVLAVLAWFLVFASLRPLRQLVRASRHVGTPHARPIPLYGPPEVQTLIRAFNAMQQRIDNLLDSNTQTMLAIAHDMRTPLSRVQLRLDGIPIEPAERASLDADLGEMRDLFTSLQEFVQADQPAAGKTAVDLAAMAQTLVDGAQDCGQDARYEGPDQLVTDLRPLPVRRALSNLIDNALHYGGSALVRIEALPDAVMLTVEDSGPGIPDESLGKVLQPFIRLDSARARNTAGMGLGLAIVDRVVRAEGGVLTLSNRPSGGLSAAIRLPRISSHQQ
ncbi:periplasmic sensor signal transduction histidine kinase [Novosphingobium nitrogenifigens DSM 19370]|uniref:histidine kinase n=1 Tax=Novosphingobium nitrogenifigens DSM 19370 TaxID=983920 RepID=F1Z8W9_9SPHN|nr:ATP-binding protein [Novosphingobium nitrogenifigens]EGD58870.1 periplasmic sensor signal transduction histidine kinase [Novosphingobium nitrogenifigens DSM 19370]